MKKFCFRKFVTIVFATFCLPLMLAANSALELNDRNKIYEISNSVFSVFADSSGEMAFSQVNESDEHFKFSKTKFFKNGNSNIAYWYKFKVKNNSDFINNWLIVSYNYSIKEIDVYVVDKNGSLTLQPHEENSSLSERLIYHKQPVFYLDLRQGDEATVFIRTIHNSKSDYEFAIYSNYYFSSYFFKEYFWYGMFYGVLAFLVVFGVVSYFIFSDKIQLLFVFLVVSQAIFMLFRDGNGLLFLIPDTPQLSELMKNLSRALFSSSLIIYCIFFLKLKKRDNAFKLMIALLALRICLFFASLVYPDLIVKTFEFVTVTFCLSLSYFRRKNGRATTEQLLSGLGILWISFLPYFLNFIGLIDQTPFYFFALYYGIGAELIFLTLATGDNIKQLRLQASNKELINKELEKKVLERTQTLENQNKLILQRTEEINEFMYLASHDIKGPIRSIKGLSELGVQDETNKNQYFERIKTTSETLSNSISDLIHFIKMENTIALKLEPIDIYQLHDEIIRILEGLPNYNKIKITTLFDPDVPLVTDKKLFSSIYQNLFENAIKYMDTSKSVPELIIKISKVENEIQLVFEDNGLGISTDSNKKVFDMFYKNSKIEGSSGLGLYIVKVSVKKLDGSIKLDSKLGEGSKFTILLPSHNLV